MTKPKRPRDPNQLAKLMIDLASGEQSESQSPPVDEAAVALGRKGGKARAKSISPERRSEIAKKAAKTRWENNSKN